MSVFKVGQRVRIVKGDPDVKPSAVRFIGRAATVIGPLTTYKHSVTGARFDGYRLAIDGIGCMNGEGLPYAAQPYMIVPLTDPRADAFMESMRNLKPLELEAA